MLTADVTLVNVYISWFMSVMYRTIQSVPAKLVFGQMTLALWGLMT